MYLISAPFRKFLLALELPITDPRTRAPGVISTFVPANSVDAWPCLLASWLNYQQTLRRIDKISVLGTKLSEHMEECPDIFQLTDDATIISIPFLCQGVIVKS